MIKEIKELKKRITKDNVSITRIAGCYVNSQKEKVTTFNKNFLNMEDQEFFKYLKIIKGIYSEKVEDQMLNLAIEDISKRQNLKALRDSKLKDATTLDAFYDGIISSYSYIGNYIILVLHDVYDVMKIGADNNKLDESEEVFEHVTCIMCPVTLTEEALGYVEKCNMIGPRIRDWVVRMPATGFIWPAFMERSAEENHIMYFEKDAARPQHEFMETFLGTEKVLTATEEKKKFEEILNTICDGLDIEYERYLMEINDKFNTILSDDSESRKETLTPDELYDIMLTADLYEGLAEHMKMEYADAFEKMPKIEHLFNKQAFGKCQRERSKEHMVGLMQQAVEVIEQEKGELELTKAIKETIGRSR